MSRDSGNLSQLDDPIATELLSSPLLARLAYTWSDGSPRVVPIWFHWDGTAVVMGTPVRAPKVRALQKRPEVAITIDSDSWPYSVLLLRGSVEVEELDSVAPEYAAAAERYFGPEQGRAWVEPLRGQPMVRLRVEPTWVDIIDFQTRFPSALSS
jgi:PPOX class probable F420-dependent enzyme